MKKEIFKELNINYYEKYEAEKEIIKDNYEKIINLISEQWGIDKREPSINIYIFISDFKFVLYSDSFFHKLLMLTILLPYWIFREKKIWKSWRGISSFQKKEPSILIKPMEHYQDYTKKDFRFQNVGLDNKENLIKTTFCHEMVHVFTHNLHLPKWLREGLSTITEDKFFKKETIKKCTINLLKEKKYKEANGEKYSFYLLLKGYWTVRYLEEEYPGFLKKIFKNYRGEEVVNEIGKKLGLNTDEKDKLWEQIDELLYNHYKYLLEEQEE